MLTKNTTSNNKKPFKKFASRLASDNILTTKTANNGSDISCSTVCKELSSEFGTVDSNGSDIIDIPSPEVLDFYNNNCFSKINFPCSPLKPMASIATDFEEQNNYECNT
jgi:hypothetical protein